MLRKRREVLAALRSFDFGGLVGLRDPLVNTAEAIAFVGPLFREEREEQVARLQTLISEFNRARKALVVDWLLKTDQMFCPVCQRVVARVGAELCLRHLCADVSRVCTYALLPVCSACRPRFNAAGYLNYGSLDAEGFFSQTRSTENGLEAIFPGQGWMSVPDDVRVPLPIGFLGTQNGQRAGLPHELFLDPEAERLFADGLDVRLARIRASYAPVDSDIGRDTRKFRRFPRASRNVPADERRRLYLQAKGSIIDPCASVAPIPMDQEVPWVQSKPQRSEYEQELDRVDALEQRRDIPATKVGRRLA